MPFARPTLQALIERAATDIEAALPGADARLRRSNLAVLARMHAGAVHGLYGYLDWLAKQVMVDTAETLFLERHAGIWGVQRRPAAYAAGLVEFSGIPGVVVPAGTQLVRSDGALFTTQVDATIDSSQVATADVVAVDAGAAGNTAALVTLRLVVAVPGVSSSARVVAPAVTQGADREDDESLRARVLERVQQSPMGGAAHDYVAWAKQVPGVTRAWCYPLEAGPGTVVVRFVRDDDASIIPDAAEVLAVQDYINTRKPVTAQATVVAPVAAPLAMTIALTPNTLAVRNAVQAELADVVRREAQPGGTILLSHLREAVSIAAGEVNSVLATPTVDVTHTANQMPVLGTITWT